MTYDTLASAVRQKASALLEVEDEETGWSKFRDEAELLNVLARILEGKDIFQSFGAPGDWGYTNSIGKALASSLRNLAPRAAEKGRDEK